MSMGKHLLEGIHARQCVVHAASRMLVGKAFRVGSYGLTAKKDTTDLV
jgi:formate dehydrogenase assembly factor FdhD